MCRWLQQGTCGHGTLWFFLLLSSSLRRTHRDFARPDSTIRPQAVRIASVGYIVLRTAQYLSVPHWAARVETKSGWATSLAAPTCKAQRQRRVCHCWRLMQKSCSAHFPLQAVRVACSVRSVESAAQAHECRFLVCFQRSVLILGRQSI